MTGFVLYSTTINVERFIGIAVSIKNSNICSLKEKIFESNCFASLWGLGIWGCLFSPLGIGHLGLPFLPLGIGAFGAAFSPL